MEITAETKLSEIMDAYPWLLDEAVKMEPAFKILNNPVGKMFIKKATIQGLSEKSGLSTEELITNILQMIANHNEWQDLAEETN